MTTFTCNTKMLNAKRSRRSILQLRQIREGRNLQDLQNLVEVPPAIQDPPSKQTMAAESPGTATTTDAGTASATNDFGYMRTHRSSRTPRADKTRPSLGDLREASVLPQLGKLTVLAPPPQIHALQRRSCTARESMLKTEAPEQPIRFNDGKITGTGRGGRREHIRRRKAWPSTPGRHTTSIHTHPGSPTLHTLPMTATVLAKPHRPPATHFTAACTKPQARCSKLRPPRNSK